MARSFFYFYIIANLFLPMKMIKSSEINWLKFMLKTKVICFSLVMLLVFFISGCSIIDNYFNKIEYNEKLAIISIRNIINQQLYFKDIKGEYVSWEQISPPPISRLFF